MLTKLSLCGTFGGVGLPMPVFMEQQPRHLNSD